MSRSTSPARLTSASRRLALLLPAPPVGQTSSSQQGASRVDSDDGTLPHEMLPWGCHYRNLVSQADHAWVAADLSADPQVALAMREAK